MCCGTYYSAVEEEVTHMVLINIFLVTAVAVVLLCA